MGLLRWLGLEDPCQRGHLPVLVPPLDVTVPVGKCGRCGVLLARCEPGWCVGRDGVCIHCGWPMR